MKARFRSMPPARTEWLASAAEAGLSAARLERIAAYVRHQCEQKLAPMMQVVVARHGKEVFRCTAGLRDIERGVRIATNVS